MQLVQVRSYWDMTGVLIKCGNLNTDVHTGKMLCENEGRHQVIILQAKESRNARKTLEPRQDN